MTVKSGLVFFYFEIILAPSELPRKAELAWQVSKEFAAEQFWRTWSDWIWFQRLWTCNMWAILINILTNTRNFAWTFCKICFPNRKNIPKRILVNKTEYWTFQIGCQKIRKDDISLTIHVWLECKIVHRGVHHYIQHDPLIMQQKEARR